jgi:hypothetical protein
MRPATIFAAFLILLAPALLAGPDIPAGKPVYGPAAGEHWQPQVASDGNGYLVIWRDGRSGDGERLLAARVARDGDVLDRVGRVVGRGTATNARPVWTGSRWAVVWGASHGSAQRVFAATVDRDGDVSAPVVIADNAYLAGTAHTASDGNTTLIAYVRGTEARAALLDRDARVVADVPLAAEGRQRTDFSVATNGEQFLVAWSDQNGDVYLQRVALDGSLIGSVRSAGAGAGALLASDGTDFVLVVRRHHGGEFTWSSRRIAADFSEVAATLPVPNGNAMSQPSLLWNGSEYLLIAETASGDEARPYNLAAARIGANGRPLASSIAVEEIDMDMPGASDPAASAATNGRSVLGAWVESFRPHNERETRVVARLYSASTLAGIGNEVLLSLGANRQNDPSVAFDAANAMVIWRELRGVYATRVSPNGVSLDERGIALSTASGAYSPEVTFDGTQFVAAWIEAGAIEIRFITAEGEVRADTLRIPNATTFSMANAGRVTVIAWTDGAHRLWATRLDRQSRSIDTPLAVTAAGTMAVDPAVSWNRRETLIVWSEVESRYYYGPTFERMRIRGARLTNAFTLIDTAPLLIGDERGTEEFSPSVASNGEDWLVTWTNPLQLRANRVLRNGTIPGSTDGTLLARAESSEVIFDGTRYAIAFRNQRVLTVGFLPAAGAIGFSSVANVGDTRSAQTEYTIVPRGDSVVLAYTRTSDAPEHTGVERAFLRTVEPLRKVRSVRR